MIDLPTYIGLVKFRKKPTRETIKMNLELSEREKKDGMIVKATYWTLGRYDAVVIMEAPDEKTVMRGSIARGEWSHVETLAAIPAEEARKLVE